MRRHSPLSIVFLLKTLGHLAARTAGASHRLSKKRTHRGRWLLAGVVWLSLATWYSGKKRADRRSGGPHQSLGWHLPAPAETLTDRRLVGLVEFLGAREQLGSGQVASFLDLCASDNERLVLSTSAAVAEKAAHASSIVVRILRLIFCHRMLIPPKERLLAAHALGLGIQ